MTTVNVTTIQHPRIQPQNLARNGKPVATTVEEQARRVANQVLAYEGKELFSALGVLPALAGDGAGAARTRWIFRAKISPHVSRVAVLMRMAKQNTSGSSGGGPVPADCAAVLEMFDASDSSIGTVEHHYGGALTHLDTSDTPDTWSAVLGYLDVPPGEEVSGIFTELDHGRLISALVYEVGPDTNTGNGYLSTAPQQGANIYADDRERLVDIVNDTWLGGAAHAVNINANDDGTPWVYASSTVPKNIIDQTSTTVSASTPGFWFDGNGKDLSRTAGAVRMVMWAFASTSDEAYVYLKDSSGAVVATVTFTGAGMPGWWSSDPFTLPATSAKYDVQAESTGGETITLWAVSIYEAG